MEYPWKGIKARYEGGETAGQIAKTPGMPTRQGINKRAKREGWERKQEPVPMGTAGNLVQIPVDLDPRKRVALEVISKGGSYKDAARGACVSEETFRVWRKDPDYLELVLAVETGIKLEMLDHVRRGAERDPKHAQWWLRHHPSTRAEFGDRASPQVSGNQYNILAHVDLGIDRSHPEQKVIDAE